MLQNPYNGTIYKEYNSSLLDSEKENSTDKVVLSAKWLDCKLNIPLILLLSLISFVLVCFVTKGTIFSSKYPVFLFYLWLMSFVEFLHMYMCVCFLKEGQISSPQYSLIYTLCFRIYICRILFNINLYFDFLNLLMYKINLFIYDF